MWAQRKHWTVPCEHVRIILLKSTKIRLISCKRSLGNPILSAFSSWWSRNFLELFLWFFSPSSSFLYGKWNFIYSNYHFKLLIRKWKIIRKRRRAILFSSLTDRRTHFDNLRLLLFCTSIMLEFIQFTSFDTNTAIEILIDTSILKVLQPALLIFLTFFGAPFNWLKLPHHLYTKRAIKYIEQSLLI